MNAVSLKVVEVRYPLATKRPSPLLTGHGTAQSYKKIAEGLGSLTAVAEDFTSTGIAGLLRGAPDLAELIERIESMYESEGGLALLLKSRY